MKGRIKKFWSVRPKLPVKWKLLCNVLFIALVLFWRWWYWDCPASDPEGAIQRLTRQLMLTEGTVELWGRDVSDDYWALVMGEDYAFVATYYNLTFPWVRAHFAEGAALDGDYALFRCPVATKDGLDADRKKGTRIMICPKGPDGAQSCTLQILYGFNDWNLPYKWRNIELEISAQREDNGIYIFEKVCETEGEWKDAAILWDGSEEDGAQAYYELSFYDAGGYLMDVKNGEFRLVKGL